MREILFKAKQVDGQGWVEGDYVRSNKKTFIRGNDVDGYSLAKHVTPETVCQFTGLLDKNGSKIFEGDMVFVDYNYLGEVTATMFNFYVKKYALNKCSVIGNIHD